MELWIDIWKNTIQITFKMRISLFMIGIFSIAIGVRGLEEINVGAGASYLSKKITGAKRSIFLMKEMVFGAETSRSPRKFQLALVGFGRTGSTSFHSSLKKLGYAPIHDDEAMEVADLLSEMTRTRPIDDIVADLGKRGFDSAFITTHKFVEWAATTDDIKVIMTVRDKEKWAKSWLAVAPAAHLLEQRPFSWIESLRLLQDFNREIMVNVPTNGKPELYMDTKTLEAGYEAWVAFVKRTVPEDRLLVFDVKQGWEPLCRFLGKPIPPEPYPHINDRVVVDATVKVMMLITWIWPLLLFLPIVIIWFFARCFIKKKSARLVHQHSTEKKDM